MKKIIAIYLSKKKGSITADEYNSFSPEKKRKYRTQNTKELLEGKFDSNSFAVFDLSKIDEKEYKIFFEHLNKLTDLTSLSLNGCQKLVDLSVIEALTNLTSLYLHGCKNLEDLSVIKALTKLRTLKLIQLPSAEVSFENLRNIDTL